MQQYSILTTNMDEILKELTGAREAAKILKKISDSKTAKELFFLEKIRAEFKKEQCHLSYQETRALILTTENVSSINIAKILNCSHSTARTHIRNAQAKYRNSLPYNNLVAWIDKNELTEYIKYYCAYLCR
ncbi:MAG: helix-turn-helix transcriptional regulator [Candidatus Lariskella arthropodorum]